MPSYKKTKTITKTIHDIAAVLAAVANIHDIKNLFAADSELDQHQVTAIQSMIAKTDDKKHISKILTRIINPKFKKAIFLAISKGAAITKEMALFEAISLEDLLEPNQVPRY
jgi:hypothetical protein